MRGEADGDCACTNAGPWTPCRIDDPPPKGHKCYCTNWWFFCSGKPIKCDSSDTHGCEGCTRKDCCLGDCGGYPKER